MSRSGYSDSCDGWDLIRWRGAVNSALSGKRGQSFLREMLEALDSMPDKRLEPSLLVKEEDGEKSCCAMGAVAIHRGIESEAIAIDPEESCDVARLFDIAKAMAKEIAFENDEGGPYHETPEGRWKRMRAWAEAQIINEAR